MGPEWDWLELIARILCQLFILLSWTNPTSQLEYEGSNGRGDYRDVPEVEKSINAWRQSEQKVMLDTIQDLIRTSHKYAKSQYTPQAQRARWPKLAGQLIWYEDQVLKSFTLEALTIEMQDLKKQVIESEERRKREVPAMNYPVIGFRRPREKKADDAETAEDDESSETVQAVEPEGAKETVSGTS